MSDPKMRSRRHTSAQAVRLQPVRENSVALALVGLLSLATMCIVATTNTVSHQHAEQLALQGQR